MIYILTTLVLLVLAISVSGNQQKLYDDLNEVRLEVDGMRLDSKARHQQTSDKQDTSLRAQRDIAEMIAKHLINPEKPTVYAMDLFRNLLDEYTTKAIARSTADRRRWDKYEKHVQQERKRRGLDT